MPLSPAFLDHPSRSADLIRSFDWTTSPLREPRHWPQSLKTAVDTVLASNAACILVWGADLITFYNDAYRGLLGTDSSDGIGMPYRVFRPEIWPFVEKPITAGFAGQATITENLKVLTRRYGDIEVAYFTASCSPVYDDDNAVVGVISCMMETTDAVRTQLKFVQHSRISAMASMAGTLAHEVNQPLAAAANYAAGLRAHLDSGASPDVIMEGVSGVEKALFRAGDIVRNLRKMSEDREPQREPVVFSNLVREAQNLLTGEWPGVQVELDLVEGAIVECDPVEMHQVLTNLIRNAYQATFGNENGRITINSRSDGERLQITVEDNGVGIEPGREEAVFDFLPLKTSGGGTGLAICRTIIEAHGGVIRAENLVPQGARLSFDLATVRMR